MCNPGGEGPAGCAVGLRADVRIDLHVGHIRGGASLWGWYPSREERGWEIQLWRHMEGVPLAEGEVDE